jgi:hypothetical protein
VSLPCMPKNQRTDDANTNGLELMVHADSEQVITATEKPV